MVAPAVAHCGLLINIDYFLLDLYGLYDYAKMTDYQWISMVAALFEHGPCMVRTPKATSKSWPVVQVAMQLGFSVSPVWTTLKECERRVNQMSTSQKQLTIAAAREHT